MGITMHMSMVHGPIGNFRVTLCLCFKRVFVQNLSFENEFDLHENEPTGGGNTFSYEWFSHED